MTCYPKNMQDSQTTPYHEMTYLPGCRFAPTDEQIIRSYLLPRARGNTTVAPDVILSVDIYQCEPDELPVQKVIEAEYQYYFHCQERYSEEKIRRKTNLGYWKSTGKDMPVFAGKDLIGKRKTLVYYFRNPMTRTRTSWIMYEYHLIINDFNLQDSSVVLCKVKHREPSPQSMLMISEETGAAKKKRSSVDADCYDSFNRCETAAFYVEQEKKAVRDMGVVSHTKDLQDDLFEDLGILPEESPLFDDQEFVEDWSFLT